MRYSVFAGGKRIRPILCMEAGRAVAGRDVDGIEEVACSLELIHTYSLIHDDLPALDNDDLRRGRPTSHKVFGEAMAILAGDAMTTLAFEAIATDADPAVSAQLALELSRAAGPAGMIGGQVLDIDSERAVLSLDDLQRVHRLKTGALLVASCRMGVISAGGDESQLAAASAFGRHLGLAFQIVDDILDETATPEQLGKATQKDAARGKNTYPSLLGLTESRAEADRQLASALDALAPFRDNAASLQAIARYVVERQK
jgi:geranylgeranyl diphosphate synthase type II